ncbi:MAG: phage holin family protein [Pseudomonadota bacterium]
MQHNLPPDFDWSKLFQVNAPLMAFALMVRLMWHQRLVRKGERRFWSVDLFWELPMAVLCAAVGNGVAEFMAWPLGGWQHIACVGVCSWLGPRGGEVMLDRIIARYSPKGSDK